MIQPATFGHESFPDTHQDLYSKTLFGFWVYLLTDFMMFATLFATYVVLRHSTFGGEPPAALFCPPFALLQTLILLTGSFAAGLAGAFAHRKDKNKTILFFVLVFLLGIAFLGMEWTEWMRLVAGGNSWRRSAFLSAFFSLIGTHSLHIILGLLWIFVLLLPVWKEGLTPRSIRRLSCLRMFWQFLNVVWVFIFALVYLGGK